MTSSFSHAMSLEEALITAYRNNPDLKAGREDLEATNEQLPQAYSGFLPNLSASYQKDRLRDKRGSGSWQYVDPETKALNLRQEVFNGGASIANVKIADNRIKAARERLRRVEQQVMIRAVQAYMDMVRAQEVLRLSMNNEKVLGEQLTAARERFRLGESTRTDVAQAESRLARAKSDRIDAEGELTASKAELQRALGVDNIDMTKIRMPDRKPILPTTFDEALQRAMQYNPDLKETEFLATAAEGTVNRNIADLLPDVSVIGSMQRIDGTSAVRGTSIESDTIGVAVSVPIFQSGSEYSRVRQAKSNAANVRQQLVSSRNNTVENVTKSWEDIQTTRSIIEAQRAAVHAAKVALDGVREEREVGSRTTLDVLDAEQEHFLTQVNLVTAERNEIIAMYNLLASMGQLTAQAIGLNVPYYNPEDHLEHVKFRFMKLP
ncbi:MAG: TolC family outer membrane protein [Hyphomicrobiales bacterium]|nr:TolC family outer membrane protein [Hyphomicrobiales bacterium]